MKHFSTPDICDAYPHMVRVVEPLFKNYGGKRSFWGQIVTIKCFEDNSKVKELSSTNGKGKVMVVDGGGSLRRSLLGDNVAREAMENGWSGFVIYGCIRDVDVIQTMDIGVKALNTIPVKTEKRGIGDIDIPIQFGGVTFLPGEYIYADSNGIIVSSKNLIE